MEIMEQKYTRYALIVIPLLFIVGYGMYWFWKERLAPRNYFIVQASQLAKENTNYRKVLYTTEKSELTLMSVPVGDEIPKETHKVVDQVFIIVEGQAEAVVDSHKVALSPESVLLVPAGTEHTIKNTGSSDLKLFTIYSPAQHPAGTIHKTKADEPKSTTSK
jgi:mannose-6-phosphate isomerase-like protein (cupin superfamily)